MPTYEYECTKCEKVFELFQPITESAKKHLKTDCKECNNKAPVRRLIGTGGGIIFKGSGFYQTDYRSEGYKKAAEADKPSTESKPTKEGGEGKSAKESAKPASAGSAESSGGTPPKKKPKRSGDGS